MVSLMFFPDLWNQIQKKDEVQIVLNVSRNSMGFQFCKKVLHIILHSYLGSERKMLTCWGGGFNSNPFDQSRGPTNVRKTIINPNIR